MSLEEAIPQVMCSPLMDKLPVEVRLQIFRCVLHSGSEFVKPVRRGTSPKIQR